MTVIPFRRSPRYLAMLALLLFGCGRKPVVTVGAALGCGAMPPKETLCIELMAATASDAELQKCMVTSIEQLIAENQILRTRYAPCAK